MKDAINLGEFDFGFTAVTADELEEVRAVRTDAEQLHESAKIWETRARTIYSAVMPLLNNLSSDADKDYIYWPDRTEKIQMFKERLQQIIED